MAKTDKTIRDFLRNELLENDVLTDVEVAQLSDVNQMAALAASIGAIDPRMRKKVKYSASVILLVALAGVFAGGQTWNEVADYGAAKLDLLKEFDPTIEEAPSHDTLRRFFMILNPSKMEGVYRSWAANMQGELKVPEGDNRNVDVMHGIRRHIAIDGKTICGAIDPEKLVEENDGKITMEYAESAKLHMVSAYNTEQGVSLAQERVEVKENELVAIPRLLECLSIGEGDVISIDAIATHINQAQNIADKGAYYLFQVKDNQRLLKQRIIKTLKKMELPTTPKSAFMTYTEISHDHSCETTRRCIVCAENLYMSEDKEKWPDFSTYGVIEKNVKKKDGTMIKENHYFITSLPKDPALIMKHKREHWQVENGLHWQLDMTFGEDKGRKMMTSAQNFSVITKMALATIKQSTRKLPTNRKRKMAGWDDSYMRELITAFIQAF